MDFGHLRRARRALRHHRRASSPSARRPRPTGWSPCGWPSTSCSSTSTPRTTPTTRTAASRRPRTRASSSRCRPWPSSPARPPPSAWAPGILLLPQRNPVYTAKEVANIDWLSGGRFDLGIGVGWCQEEFAAVDVSWPKRGKRTDEYIAVMRSLWTEDVSSFSGEFYELDKARMYPKPAQANLPIHIGGRVRRRHGPGRPSGRRLVHVQPPARGRRPRAGPPRRPARPRTAAAGPTCRSACAPTCTH